MSAYADIAVALAQWQGPIDGFVRQLDADGVPYISFSKVAAFEFCPQRYLLEYVQRIPLDPEPAYFRKGRLFHDVAARIYRAKQGNRPVAAAEVQAVIAQADDEDDRVHLRNAHTLILDNLFHNWEVIAVEEPFALDLGRELPVCIGIVDLVLRRGDGFAVVDHKSGKQFNEPDKLQLALYRQHVAARHGPGACLAYFDEYRWVNNLQRIRKPAFQRTQVKLTAKTWPQALCRIERRHRQMLRIEQTGKARGGGPCYMCPFKGVCPKAVVRYGGWY